MSKKLVYLSVDSFTTSCGQAPAQRGAVRSQSSGVVSFRLLLGEGTTLTRSSRRSSRATSSVPTKWASYAALKALRQVASRGTWGVWAR